MKKFNSFLTGSFILCASLFIFSCTKQVAEPQANEVTIASSTPSPTNCQPAVFGVYQTSSSGNSWSTIAQKWYENGKVKYFKGNFSGAALGQGGLIGVEPQFNIQWGEVTYVGNQVYLRDVGKNRLVLRVTVDGSGKPLASYFYNNTDNADNAFLYDTTYYYYAGDKLDYIISFSELRLYDHVPIHLWGKWTFDYDVHGNMTGATTSGGGAKMNLIYDYTKPVGGIVANYMLTSSFRLMEFLELIKVPMHHALKETNFGHFSFPSGNFFILFQSKYKNYVITDGLVQSYESDHPFQHKETYYNGWDCGALPPTNESNRQNNSITTLEQFKQAYPSK